MPAPRAPCAPGKQTFMVHKRLSIVAPGPDGDQPLYTDESHDTTFICNGEIYNHQARA